MWIGGEIMLDVNTRTSEVLFDGEWQSFNTIDIKKGMIFRMFEDDGTLVSWDFKEVSIDSWTALRDAYYNEDGIISIDIDLLA